MPKQDPLVPQFRELEITGGKQAFDAFTAEVERLVVPPWERDREVEQSPLLRGEYRVFRRLPSDGLPQALLHLVADDKSIRVANIVPVDTSQIELDQYNQLLVEFHEGFARPAAENIGLETWLGDDHIDLARQLDSGPFWALTAFSRTANRSTGSSHPQDRERWFEFLVLLHRSGTELSSQVLQEWLILDGWSDSVAFDLAIEFEFGMGLLRHAERG